MRIKIRSKLVVTLVLIGAVVAMVGSYVWRQEHRQRVLEIYVFALDSGRSIFIRTPEDRRIIVDGGANRDVVREVTRILPFYTRRIDALIATNTEGKNVAGLIDVLERYDVERVYVPRISVLSLGLSSSTDEIYDTFLERVKAAGLRMDEVGEGDTIDLDPKVNASVIFPARDKIFRYSKASPPELLLNISYGETSVMLLGNASAKVQKYLASTTGLTVHTIGALIVSHSALPANISEKLISRLRPRYLVYSKTTSLALSTKPKKPVVDPFEYIPTDHKLNIKKEGTTHFVSDGADLRLVP